LAVNKTTKTDSGQKKYDKVLSKNIIHCYDMHL